MSETNGSSADAASANGHFPADAGDAAGEARFRATARPDGARAGNGEQDAVARIDWFLRTGRAGLLPESMTESWEDDSGPGEPHSATVGAPPWAGDAAEPGQDAPPPWESGPWPARGEARPGPGRSASPAAADTGNWQSIAAVVTGLIPVVIPGLVLGVLGLRRARVTGTGRPASWLAIAFSVIWAVVLAVWLASAGSAPAAACGGDQNGVTHAVSQVLHDLAGAVPRSVVTADLHQAINEANTAAARAQQVAARNAMATLTAGLQQVATEASGGTSDGALHQQVAAAEAAMVSACKA